MWPDVDERDASNAVYQMDGKELSGRALRVNKPREPPRNADAGGPRQFPQFQSRPTYRPGPGSSQTSQRASQFDMGDRVRGTPKYDRVTGDLIKD